jgi:HK97 family phage prohead protease
MPITRKFLPTTAKTDGLGDRQVRVIISTPDVDRAGDIVKAEGIDLSAYRANPTVLWNHDPNCPVARCVDIAVKNGAVEALVQFPPEGDDAEADKLYRRIKNGQVNAASIGFNSIKAEPIKGGGLHYSACELLEFSFVSVPANSDALIVERSAEWEAEYEGDDSPVPQMLTDAMRQLGEALIAMTVEEVRELLGEETGGDMKAAAAKIKSVSAIIKAGRVLSAANEADIRAACELMQGASEKLTGVLEQTVDSEEKRIDVEHYRRKARLAALRSAA